MSLGLEDDEREKEADHGPFEGVEKKLVIDFTGKGSLRDIERSKFDVIFSNAVCSALSCTSNDEFDAFVLSESSCFVYDKRIILKTCGTTEPIGAVPAILTEADKQGLAASSTLYCHMDFLFPDIQSPSYRSFAAERSLLQKHFPASEATCLSLKSPGNSSWHLYTTGCPTHDCLEVLMYDLSRETMDHFFQQKHKPSLSSRSADGFLDTPGAQGRKKSVDVKPSPASRLDRRIGISRLSTKGAVWDSFLFEPCGYSSNAILDGTYWTIHVTPEEESSYVSFECSPRPDDISATVKKVLAFFMPQKFSLVVTGNDEVDGPSGVDGFVTEGSASGTASGYRTWTGHFATPEHIAARPLPPPATAHSTLPSDPLTVRHALTSRALPGCDASKLRAGSVEFVDLFVKSKEAKYHDDMKCSDEDLKNRAWNVKMGAPEARRLLQAMEQGGSSEDWEAHSSTEEDELAQRYEVGTRESMDETTLAKRSACKGGMNGMGGMPMKVVG